MTPEGLVESILFVSGRKVSKSFIQSKVKDVFGDLDIHSIVNSLNSSYIQNSRPFRILEISDGYQLAISDEYYEILRSVFGDTEQDNELTDTLLETLTIIAYKQPIEKSEIDKIRGVSSSKAISTLLEKGFIKPIGNDNISDKISYITTEKFLEYFNLKNLSDLPDIQYIKETLEK